MISTCTIFDTDSISKRLKCCSITRLVPHDRMADRDGQGLRRGKGQELQKPLVAINLAVSEAEQQHGLLQLRLPEVAGYGRGTCVPGIRR